MKIVIVEDHVLTRDLLHLLCERDLHHQVVGQAGDGREGVEVILRSDPDLVLLDLHLPELSGFGVAEILHQAGCRPRILALSSHCDAYTVYRIEHIRIDGFVDKMFSLVSNLQEAITTVAAGRSYFSDSYRRAKTERRDNPEAFDKVLSPQEQRILVMVGDMLVDREIAERLAISDLTVEKHRANMQRKLALGSRMELIRYARRHGFTEGKLVAGSSYFGG